MPDGSGSPGHAAARRPGDDRERAFFGRRKGHPLRPHQAALHQSLLPKLAIDIRQPSPTDLRQLFAVSVDDVRLEIGFGGGEHLVHQARANPQTGFIGVEPFLNGMAKALSVIEAENIRNIRLWPGDALHLIVWLPATSLSRIDLLYPDPWPKRRHWKRRFVQDDTVKALAGLLRDGGAWRYATDIPDYAAWTLARVLRSQDFEWTAERAEDWLKPWPDFVRTRYEAKAVREGRAGNYFTFRKAR